MEAISLVNGYMHAIGWIADGALMSDHPAPAGSADHG